MFCFQCSREFLFQFVYKCVWLVTIIITHCIIVYNDHDFAATPVISSIYSTDQSVFFESADPLTLSVPGSLPVLSLTCLAHGLPIPTIRWVDTNGTQLSNIFISRPCGIVKATLQLNTLSQLERPVQCQVINSFGNESKLVAFDQPSGVTPNTTNDNVMDLTTDTETVSIRVKLDTTNCSVSL